MVTVTESAKQELKGLLDANVPDPEIGLRLAPSAPGQFGLLPDQEREGDQVVEHEGSKVLLIGMEVMTVLEGATIDCQLTEEGPRLVINK